MTRFWLLETVFYCCGILGCVTLPRISSQERESILNKYSSDCRSLEGSHVVSFSQGTKFISLDLDWISKSDGSFIGNVVDPLGRTVAEWTMNGAQLSFATKIQSPLAMLGIDRGGFLTFDQQSSFIKAGELSCLLKGLVPANWLGLTRGSSSNWESNYRDRERKIVVTNDSKDICGSISPSGIIGWFVKPIHFCTHSTRGELSWGDQFRLEWRSLDEPGS